MTTTALVRRPMIACLVSLLLGACLTGCPDAHKLHSGPPIDNTQVGQSSVDLLATREAVRTGEAAIGNLIADAMLLWLDQQGKGVDIATVNGGSIRFNAATRPEGIYSAGMLTRQDVKDMLPFDNTLVILVMSGAEIKTAFERSIALWPDTAGGFLQVSRGFQVIYDTTAEAQVVGEGAEGIEFIASPGARVVSMSLNGQPLVAEQSYRLAAMSFVAGGGDSFVSFAQVPEANREDTGVTGATALEFLLNSQSPVAPQVEGRLEIH